MVVCKSEPLIHFSVDYAGENFVRFSGDAQKHSVAQLFAWEAYEKGVDVHLLAEPTKLEMLQKEYNKKKDQFKSQVQERILQRYGGDKHLQAPPKSLLLGQTEDYVEYSRYGKVIKVRVEPFTTVVTKITFIKPEHCEKIFLNQLVHTCQNTVQSPYSELYEREFIITEIPTKPNQPLN